MPVRVAIAGKGGTGKTSFAAMLIRTLQEGTGGTILAVDADPNSNLHEALGIAVPRTVADVLEEVKTPGPPPAGMPKSQLIEYRLRSVLVETPRLDLLSMGTPEGPGCYCFPNDLIRHHLAALARDYDFLVVDNEAGMEHLSRRVAQDMDMTFVLSDATVRGLRTAGRIRALVDEIGLKPGRVWLVVNRVVDRRPLEEAIAATGLEVGGFIPDDKGVADLDLHGEPLARLPAGSPALQAVLAVATRAGLTDGRTSD
ncbi:MAG TPA: carbon monoxide dehydrogenase [Clostridiales bacterium]|nr:carbon monoxide dehydrogenase [Clostridiales bacterium]